MVRQQCARHEKASGSTAEAMQCVKAAAEDCTADVKALSIKLQVQCQQQERDTTRLAGALDELMGRPGHAGGLANIAERVDCLAASLENLDVNSRDVLARERAAREHTESKMWQQLQQEK